MNAELDKIASAPGGDVPAPPSPGAGEPEGYELWPKPQLVEECRARELPHSGDKPRLVNELRADDALKSPDLSEAERRANEGSERPF